MVLQLLASDWEIDEKGRPTLIKPCGCKVFWCSLDGGYFDWERHTCRDFGSAGKSDADLRILRDKMLQEVREEDGEIVIEFSKLYRRKRQCLIAELASLQEKTYRAVMELADRHERELQIGPYSATTVELMSNLARESEPTPTFIGYDDEFEHNSTPLRTTIEHDPLQRSYYIRLDADGRPRTYEEMARDIQAGLMQALTDHNQEIAARLMPEPKTELASKGRWP